MLTITVIPLLLEEKMRLVVVMPPSRQQTYVQLQTYYVVRKYLIMINLRSQTFIPPPPPLPIKPQTRSKSTHQSAPLPLPRSISQTRSHQNTHTTDQHYLPPTQRKRERERAGHLTISQRELTLFSSSPLPISLGHAQM